MTQFHHWHDFWQMGGYGVYVWAAYAVVMAAILGQSLSVWQKSRRLQKRGI